MSPPPPPPPRNPPAPAEKSPWLRALLPLRGKGSVSPCSSRWRLRHPCLSLEVEPKSWECKGEKQLRGAEVSQSLPVPSWCLFCSKGFHHHRRASLFSPKWHIRPLMVSGITVGRNGLQSLGKLESTGVGIRERMVIRHLLLSYTWQTEMLGSTWEAGSKPRRHRFSNFKWGRDTH